MKKILFLIFASIIAATPLSAEEVQVDLTSKDVDKDVELPEKKKAPAVAPSLFLDDHRLFWKRQHPGYTIYIVKDDAVEFTTYVNSVEKEVNLPGYLTGTYTIQLINGRLCWYGEIEL